MSLQVEQGFFDFNSEKDNAGHYLSAEWPYFVFGQATEAEALDAVLSEAPSTFNGLRLDRVKFQEQLNEDTCKVLVTYKTIPGELSGDEGEAFSFDTTGGTQTVTQSKSTVASYVKTGATAPNFGGAINYDGEQVNGVEIIQPVLNFDIVGVFTAQEVTTTFLNTLMEMTSSVNSTTWRGRAAGTVLFRGVTGSGKTNAPCDLTFHFSYSPNRSNFTVGEITVSEKKGWDYMWVYYGKSEDTSSKTIVRKPLAVYIEQLFELKDFDDLNLDN